MLDARGAKVQYADPHVDEIRVDDTRMRSAGVSGPELKKYDCVVIVTDHSAFNYDMIVRNARSIVDTRNALKKYTSRKITRI